MNDWKSLLRDADRRRDAAIGPGDAERIRRIVVAAARGSVAQQPIGWSRAFVVASTVLIVICASVLTALQRSLDESRSDAAAIDAIEWTAGEGDPEGGRQQLQFTSPGGTRIIWVFNSQFEVKGSLP